MNQDKHRKNTSKGPLNLEDAKQTKKAQKKTTAKKTTKKSKKINKK